MSIFTLVWANEFYYELIGWPKGEYEAKVPQPAGPCYGDDQELWDDLTQTVIKAVEATRPDIRWFRVSIGGLQIEYE